MKKIKLIFLLILSIACIELMNDKINNYAIKSFNSVSNVDTIKGTPYIVVGTMYYATKGQCDSDPLITAGMYKINPKTASQEKWIALSRNLIARWGGEFEYGDFVEIKGAGHKDGIYKVVDTMNKRFTNRIDFLENLGTKHYKFDNVQLTKIEWKQKEQNLLASI